jgi:hypothetical protein
MRNLLAIPFAAGLAIAFAACSDSTSPTPATDPNAAPSADRAADPASEILGGGHHGKGFDLNIVLRGDGWGFLDFRQPDDGVKIVDLDIWVFHLAPNASYLLQRAVDPVVDDNCTSSDWLTLGKGLTPQTITTNRRGIGRQHLFRDLTAVASGTPFDIHFRVIDAATSAVVLTSRCYQFTVNAQ